MRRINSILALILLLTLVLSGCSSPKLGGAERKPLTDEEKQALYEEIVRGNSDKPVYSEDGVRITSDYRIEVETWKLNKLAEAYSSQNPFTYLKKVEKIEENEGDWMASKIITEDFTATVRLYGDDDIMTLEIALDEDSAGKYVLAPEACIINGIVKVKTLFKASEPEKGKFLITANMKDFNELGKFGLTMGNISSVAWYMGVIDLETKELNSFLIASAFPDDYSWQGLTVSKNFAAAQGLIMWVLHDADYSYLCVFNGSELKINTEVEVTAGTGQLIGDKFKVDVNSGEFTYQQLGFNLTDVVVKSGDNILLKE